MIIVITSGLPHPSLARKVFQENNIDNFSLNKIFINDKIKLKSYILTEDFPKDLQNYNEVIDNNGGGAALQNTLATKAILHNQDIVRQEYLV